MSVSVFDHLFLCGLLGDDDITPLFTARAEIDAMLRFETTLAKAQAEEGVVPGASATAIEKMLKDFQPNIEKLREGTARDGVIVPELVEQMRAAVGPFHAPHLHFGATSQDVIDTALALRLATANRKLAAHLTGCIDALETLEKRDGALEIMAHTRMQGAYPVLVKRKTRSWREPLMRHLTRLESLRPEVEALTLGGATGTLDKLGDKGPAVAKRLAEKLGLSAPLHARHCERDGLVDYAGWLSLVTGSLGKFGQDVALMAQNEVGAIKLSAGGGSSVMPHKRNPVKAEILVTLARFNATLLSGMHQALVHENERSGAAWTLEWMLLPQMVSATGAALRRASELAGDIKFATRKFG